MEISLLLTNDSGSYQAIVGQFIETAIADTLADRLLAQQAAASATASAATADSDATAAATSENNAANSESAAAASATSAGSSATAAGMSATNASTSATNSANSATAAGNYASAASTSETNAANSATSAANSAAQASAVLSTSLLKANNLSDVASPSTALANIGGAALAGSTTQAFSVADATGPNQAASLEQVQTYAEGYTSFYQVSASFTLTTAYLGAIVYWTPSTAGTITLLSGALAFLAAKIRIVNSGTATLTVVTGGSDQMSITGATFTSVTLGPGDDFEVARAVSTTRWAVIGGSARAYLTPLRVANATLSTQAPNLAQTQAIGFSFQQFTATVASNALTLGMPATTLQFRSLTLASAVPVAVSNASALSLVIPSGATLGTTAAVLAKLAVLALYDGTNVYLGVCNLVGGLNLDDSGLISTTAISASATSASVAYSTSALTNVAFRVLGYVEVTEATAGTWATAPTKLINDSYNAPIWRSGYGRTWQNVTASRVSGTSYTNNTGRDIEVAISASPASSGNVSPTVQGVNISYQANSISAGQVANLGSFTVPAGGTYSSSVATLNIWAELR